MKVDILFIHPGNQKKTYQDLANEFTAIAPPSWTSLLAGSMMRKGKTVAVYDANLRGWTDKMPTALIGEFNPELIVIMVYGHNPSASTQTMPAAGMIANDIKKYNKDIPIAMGGIHPSALPEKTLREEKIDFVIQGEGIYTISELHDYLSGKRKLEDVRGLWYKKDKIPLFTCGAPVTKDLDNELPGYYWEILPDLNFYRAHNMHCFQYFEDSKMIDFSDVRSPYVAMNTSLGCPYNCSYCCINSIFGKSGIRYWSIEKVLSWFDDLVERGVKNIRIDDELFILSPNRVERLCDALIEREYNLNIWVYGRVDTIHNKLLNKLYRAGISWICLGIESGNQNVASSVNKRIHKNVKEVVRSIQNHGIYVLGNYMFGLPEDNLDTMQQTLDLAIELNCEFANFYTVMPLPGSALYKSSQTNSEKWQEYSQHSYETRPMPTKYLTPKEVLQFRDNAFYSYYKNENYLNSIEKKFGLKTRQHIEKMTSIPIRRKLFEEKE